MAEREDAAETIQRIWRGRRGRACGEGSDEEGGRAADDGFDADAAFDDSSYYLQRSLTGYGQMIVDAEECEVDEELEASGAALASGAASEAPGAAKAPPGRWKKAQAKVHDVGRAAAGVSNGARAAAAAAAGPAPLPPPPGPPACSPSSSIGSHGTHSAADSSTRSYCSLR